MVGKNVRRIDAQLLMLSSQAVMRYLPILSNESLKDLHSMIP